MVTYSAYGTIALKARERARAGEPPDLAWKREAQIVYPDKNAAREKGCPRNAFRGLAEGGYIVGVAKGSARSRSVNARYAVEAAEVLRMDAHLASDRIGLWRRTSGGGKQHNGQMDVVVALFFAGCLREAPD